jgi:hypothetical protein
MGKVHICREVQLTAADVAGRTSMADMAGTATANVIVPAGYSTLEAVRVAGGSDAAALGSGVGVLILEGNGLLRAPQHVAVFGAGAEVTNAGHGGVKASKIGPGLGIKVRAGQEFTSYGIMVGEDMGTITLIAEFIFSNEGGDLLHEGGEIQCTAIDTDIQFQGMGDGANKLWRVPGGCNKIGTVQTAMGCDLAALGSGGVVAKLSGNGVVHTQEIVLGACGGENTTAAGFQVPADIDLEADIEVRPNDTIRIDGRMVGEDIGTASAVIIVGWVMG